MISRERLAHLRVENDAERLSYGEIAEIQEAFNLLDPSRLVDHPENATIGDMLDELEYELPPERPCIECGIHEDEEHGMCGSCLHDAYRSGWQPGTTTTEGPRP